MNTSFLYHAFGIREQECSQVRYEDKQIVLNLQTKTSKLLCSVVKRGCRKNFRLLVGNGLELQNT
jgi:hypothetical protein